LIDFKKSAGVLAAAALSSDITQTFETKRRATADLALQSLCSVCHLFSGELGDQKALFALPAAVAGTDA